MSCQYAAGAEIYLILGEVRLTSGGLLWADTFMGCEYDRADPRLVMYPEHEDGRMTLFDALLFDDYNYAQIIGVMTQRLQEIDPSFTSQKLIDLLKGQWVRYNCERYFIYPKYLSPDLTDPVIKIAPAIKITRAKRERLNIGAIDRNGGIITIPPRGWQIDQGVDTEPNPDLPPWLNQNYKPDGAETLILSKTWWAPNADGQRVVGGTPTDEQHFADNKLNVYWEPDSGFDQCLGQMRFEEHVECHYAERRPPQASPEQ